MLIGFGGFNVVEGLVDHHLLGIHHVNEIVDPAYRSYFDAGFILWGILMLILLVLMATAPLWRLAVFGFNPALDDFLAFICSSSP